MHRKVAIFGDSFASEQSLGWTRSLDTDLMIDNFASNGSSEYRIFKTIQNIDIHNYDFVIVVHTSPNRIFVEQNPYYKNSITHTKCDLIYEDMFSRQPDNFAKHVCWWFENVFDLNNALDIHKLLIEKIINLLSKKPCMHLTFFELNNIKSLHVLHHIWKNHPGKINHLDTTGNQMVADFVKKHLQYITKGNV